MCRSLATLSALCVAIVSSIYAAEIRLSGHVTDENDAPVAGVRITVRPGPIQTQTDPAGVFSITLPGPGDYRIDASREHYYELKDRPVHVERAQDIVLVINSLREVFQSVDVNEQPSPVDIAETRNQEQLSGTEVNDIPFTNSHSLRNAMILMPGVVEDAGGGMHFNGASENQVQYVLNGFDITDPISGQFNSVLAVEGIRSVDYSSGRFSPQYGKGSAGVLALSTENGTDAFHYTATDFIPGLNVQSGVRLGSWYPRVGVSGPIVKGHAWFSDTFDSQYSNALITGLPPGQNTRSGWAGSNLLHVQINLTPRNIVFADFLVNVSNQGRVGLAPLSPVSTTQNQHTHEYFASIKDQVFLGGRSMIEFGYAHNAFTNRVTPQGDEGYDLSPQGASGNYFVTSTQTSSRDQGLIHGFLPEFHFAGSHQVEAGVDVALLNYNGDFHRTGYSLVGLNGEILTTTYFYGPGIFTVHDTEAAGWVLDTWRVTKRLQIDWGFREEGDTRVASTGWSPRVAFSWAPFAGGKTRIAGGYSITHDAVPLDPFGRTMDQSAETFAILPAQSATTTFGLGPQQLKLPRATNWSLSVDHEITPHLFVSVKFLDRRGRDGFDFLNVLAPGAPPSLLPLPNGVAPGEYQLANLRRDNFDSVQFSVRQNLSGQFEWMASYTRSRAQSNAVLDFNTLTPLSVLPTLSPMPWDAPNRVLGWAYLPLPLPFRPRKLSKNWSIVTLVDARTGFPFSVQDQNGIIVGPVDSHRYPLNLDLNLAIERMITLHGYRFALRGGADNLTNSRNPTAVYNTVGAPNYLQFLGDEGRHFVVRIRFFGRAGTK